MSHLGLYPMWVWFNPSKSQWHIVTPYESIGSTMVTPWGNAMVTPRCPCGCATVSTWLAHGIPWWRYHISRASDLGDLLVAGGIHQQSPDGDGLHRMLHVGSAPLDQQWDQQWDIWDFEIVNLHEFGTLKYLEIVNLHEFTHEKWWIFPVRCMSSPGGTNSMEIPGSFDMAWYGNVPYGHIWWGYKAIDKG